MIKILIYREQHGALNRVTIVDVADNAPDPEGAGWNAYTRGGNVPTGTYIAVRAGKRFRAEQKTSIGTTSLGPMT